MNFVLIILKVKTGAYVENTGVEIIDMTSHLHSIYDIQCRTYVSLLVNAVQT